MKEQERISRITKALTAYGLALAVAALAVLFVVSDKKDFSENENRYLADMPVFTWEAVRSGAYMEDWSDYLSDHFPFRDAFVGAKTQVLTILGRQEVNGVFLAQGDCLIEEYAEPQNTEQIGEILKKFAAKLDGKARLRLMLVPTAVYVYEERLPKHAQVKNQMETARRLYDVTGIEPIDCSDELMQNKKDGELYYRTDHHWTTFGAYVGYQTLCREMGFDTAVLEEWEAQVVTEDFFGTLYSKANDYSLSGDIITVYSRSDDNLTVEYLDTGVTTDSLYNMEYIEKKDKYSLFLDNLHTLIEITNQAAESDRTLVLIKDSYANSIVPFLAHHYQKIYVFDTRYYKNGPASFIEALEGDVDVVLLYNLNTLDADLGVRGVY